MQSMLKTTTALLASLSLLVPTVSVAQTRTLTVECADDPEALCDAITGAPVDRATEEPATEDAGDAETPEAPDAPAAEQPSGGEEAGPEQPLVDDSARNAPMAPQESAPEEPAAEEPAPEEPAAEEPAPEEAEEPALEQPAAEEPAPEEAEEPAAEEPAREQPSAEEPAADGAATETGRTLPPSIGQAPAADDDTAETPAPEAPEDTAAQPDTPAEPEAPAAAAATGDGEPMGEPETETVTEDTARSSSEDFQGTINSRPGSEAASGDGEGLSNFEKALLVGAGALAVGAIIRGNREVVSTADDRVVVSRDDGSFEVLKDDNALLRQPGSTIDTQTFSDGSTLTTTTREDGSQVITIRDADLRVVRRTLVRPDGSEVALIDDTQAVEPVDVSRLPEPAPALRTADTEEALREALMQQRTFDRRFSLAQVRQITEVRELAPVISVDTITFDTGSAAIRPEQAQSLTRLGLTVARMIEENPQEIFLVEGHTDATGPAGNNLLLSDRRAESLALALTEYFGVAPENLVVQGYGESNLLIQTEAAEEANRRAGLRRITPLLQASALE